MTQRSRDPGGEKATETKAPDAVRRAQRAGSVGIGRDGQEIGASVPKLETGIPGFDDVTIGGLPLRRATVVAGQAGSAKTVFAGQFLAEGVRRGEPAVFVTLEEPARDLRANLTTLGADIATWESDDIWRFVDASPMISSRDIEQHSLPPYSLEALSAQIGHAVDATAAQRVVLDSLNAMLSLQPDAAVARQQLRTLIGDLRAMGVTFMLTVETVNEPGGALSPFGVEEFVADNVVLLHNTKEGRVRRRSLEVLKMRGAMHHKGEVAFTVLPGQGVVVLPMPRHIVEPDAEPMRVPWGNSGVDDLLGGGLLSGSTTLVSGSAGTGKTLMATEFLATGLSRGERCLLLEFEVSERQVRRNAAALGFDFETDLLTINASHPDVASFDDHLVDIFDLVRRDRPTRLALDSLSALERLGSTTSYREFILRLTSFLKEQGITSVLTVATPALVGTTITEGHVSAMTDAIILLRHVEVFGAVRRGISVLKVRGSPHSRDIREFTIDNGMTIGEPFRGVSGILTGIPSVHGTPQGSFPD